MRNKLEIVDVVVGGSSYGEYLLGFRVKSLSAGGIFFLESSLKLEEVLFKGFDNLTSEERVEEARKLIGKEIHADVLKPASFECQGYIKVV